MLRHPFFILYSCYWGFNNMYAPFVENDFPVLWELSYSKIGLLEHFTMNFLFNLGYIVKDV